ncbi:MAG TPA: galactokinase, partial [Stenomitos sp.]
MLEHQLGRVRDVFQSRFGTPDLTIRAPGRVNLIGEHTDYNEGFVFPVAIDREVVISARRRDDSEVRLYSVNYDQADSFDLGRIDKVAPGTGAPTWSNYVRGILSVFQDAGHKLGGFEAVLEGNVPQGAGLSSSAALEVATGTLLKHLFHLDLDGKQIALLGQRAENVFVGVQCGIMDQFISALGQRDHALMIDCRSLDYRAVPLHLGAKGASIVIVDSKVKRGLVDSKYNERRAECQEAVERLRELLGRPMIKSLRDVTLSDLDHVGSRLPHPVHARALHVVSENARVLKSVEALEAGDLDRFGSLMNQSHESLKSDFEVSCPEIDLLVSLARGVTGTYGSRITGGGFGGCTVSLV